MCGIVGIIGKNSVTERLIDGLRRLEYRGYDSAGIATLMKGQIHRRRAPGKLVHLQDVIHKAPLDGVIGIGHTRWATHGAATEENAHPHATSKVAVVHNGIIENFARIRAELMEQGHVFTSQSDTEVIPHLITHHMASKNLGPAAAFQAALKDLRGAFAIGAMIEGEEEFLLCARKGSPLAIGRGEGEIFLGSDSYALAPFTNRITYLEDGDWAILRRDGFEIFNIDGQTVSRPEALADVSAAFVDKAGHRHFMAKEIHEQAEVIGHTLSNFIDPTTLKVQLPEGEAKERIDFRALERLTVSACGTAHYAGLVSKYWFEKWARLPVEIDIASELRYRDVPYPENGAAIFISQSGETADTYAALVRAKDKGQTIGAIVNVVESTIAREADAVLPIRAGPEIGVASTKAFTCQLAALACIAIAAGVERGFINEQEEQRLVQDLLELPRLVSEALKASAEIEEVAQLISEATDILYLGRGVNFPLAMEGALKLKEISYIHAEGYASGELKHGPIALIDEHVPVIVVAPEDDLFEKSISNMHEVMARGGKCVLLSSKSGIDKAREGGAPWKTLPVEVGNPDLAPITYAVPIQLLAYHTAVAKGTDVDQPRNLAKSVTVE